MNRHTTLTTMVALACAIAFASGCSAPPADLSSAWPKADSERVVDRPPVPPRWPYTGAEAPDERRILRRPLSIKIENSAASRPQVGINAADVVYETVTEGGITRFNCVFHSTVPETVGPVRSARLSDLWLVPQYNGLFFFSGASASVNAKVREAGLPNLSQDIGVSRPYWRSSERAAPHNLMLDTEKAYAEAKSRGLKTTARASGLLFDRRTIDATPAVNEITIPFSQANTAKWLYDAGSGQYLRWNNGSKHKDAATGDQVTADNVVVMWAKYRAASKDMVGSTTYDIDLGGEGRVTVFRDGTRLDGTWTARRDAPPRFLAADGTPIRLSRGRTWFQVIPLDGTIAMK